MIMNFASKLVENVFGLTLSPSYALIFLSFVLFCIGFIIWAIYYATVKKAAAELSNVTWLSLKDTLKYTSITVLTIMVFSLILFFFDTGVDKLINSIIQNGN